MTLFANISCTYMLGENWLVTEIGKNCMNRVMNKTDSLCNHISALAGKAAQPA